MQALAEAGLIGRCVLVVEDDFLIAIHLSDALSELGMQVVGPAASVSQALALLSTPQQVDAALLDVNLGGELVYAVADALLARAIPFVFVTGYDTHCLPVRFAGIACRQKPLHPLDEIRRLLTVSAPGRSG